MVKGVSVALGPLVPDDFVPLFRWSNDPEVARYNGAFRPADWISHRSFWENIGKDPSRVVFAIRRLDDPALIGYVNIFSINPVYRSAELGITIGDAVNRGRGFGREALALALSYCWNHLNLHRVAIAVFKSNERALRTYRASGFKREGVLKHAVFIDGAWIDLVLMATFRPAHRGRPSRAEPDAADPGARDREALETASAGARTAPVP
jgi:RimJ/RimL family protein N-acetyltransferase